MKCNCFHNWSLSIILMKIDPFPLEKTLSPTLKTLESPYLAEIEEHDHSSKVKAAIHQFDDLWCEFSVERQCTELQGKWLGELITTCIIQSIPLISVIVWTASNRYNLIFYFISLYQPSYQVNRGHHHGNEGDENAECPLRANLTRAVPSVEPARCGGYGLKGGATEQNRLRIFWFRNSSTWAYWMSL